jgi:hypothetical protein
MSIVQAFGCTLILLIATCLWAVTWDIVRKARERRSNVIRFPKRAGWMMVDFRIVARRRRKNRFNFMRTQR